MVTEKGFIGLAPQIKTPGDVAFVIVEVGVPLILRPYGESRLFKLLGVSYIHGFMGNQQKRMVDRNKVV